MMLDLPPGGLRTLTEVLASVVWLLSWRGTMGLVLVVGLEVLVLVLVVSHPSEKLLLPPGAWCTLTEVVPAECFEKSISN